MALKNILNTQDAFTGEFPAAWAPDGLWRFNESEPDADDYLADSSGKDRKAYESIYEIRLLLQSAHTSFTIGSP